MGGRPLSLRRSFIWNFAGNGLYNFGQWLLLVVLARVASPQIVGQFFLTLAVSAPVFLTVGMNLRTVQATDAASRWKLADYLLLRHILNVAAVFVAMAVGYLIGMRDSVLVALAVICLAKCVESVSHTYYGFFQRHERLDLVSRSLIVRSATGPAFFLLGYLLTDELTGACLGLGLGWLLPQLLLDRRNVTRLAMSLGIVLGPLRSASRSGVLALARKSAPLGLDAGISSLALNVPRYAVNFLLGSAQLGIFAGLAYLAQAISMVTTTMAVVVVTRLAQYHHEGRRSAFTRTLGKLVLFALAVLAVTVAGSAVIGGPFLRLTLGPEYVDRALMMALMVSAGLMTLQRSLCKGLEASLHYKTYLLVDLLTTGVVAASVWPLIQSWGLLGAAAAIAVGFAVGCLAAGCALVFVIRAMPTQPREGLLSTR